MATHEAQKVVKTWVGADGHALPFTAMQDGVAYDLTGKTVTIKATYGGNDKIDNSACTVTDEAAGEFEYTPTAAQVDEAGDYAGQVKIVSAGKTDFLEKVTIRVQAVV